MNSLFTFFEHIHTWQLFVWVAGWMFLFGVLETLAPAFPFSAHRWRHAGVNLSFLISTAVVNGMVGLLTAGVYVYLSQHQTGLLSLLSWSPAGKFILSLLLLDFIGMYCSHYVLHQFKWLWKFHMVHHSDRHVDVTTGTRHHPGDWLIRELFALVAILVLGAPVSFYFMFRFINVVFTYFTHANFSLPPWLEHPLSWIFITPQVHKFHHHHARPWTDTNYGNIFSIWDRLFGTYATGDIHQVVYGLDVLEGKPDENVKVQFTLPFDRSVKTDT
jgi:sterol desaturase/sphingolipid hydroxylase (fatty acid hydroxylase superfamily)